MNQEPGSVGSKRRHFALIKVHLYFHRTMLCLGFHSVLPVLMVLYSQIRTDQKVRSVVVVAVVVVVVVVVVTNM